MIRAFNFRPFFLALTVILLGAATAPAGAGDPAPPRAHASAAASQATTARATFAGGCFWCMEGPFEKLDGAISVTSGYSGGPEKNPTYQQVGAGITGHAESVEIVYDPEKISYQRLLEVYWHNIDPTSANGQFCDRGKQYRSAIFYRGETQHRLAAESKERLESSGRFKQPIATQIVAFRAFYPAEEYHQDYYKKNPKHYHEYREGCGRDARLREIWGEAAGH